MPFWLENVSKMAKEFSEISSTMLCNVIAKNAHDLLTKFNLRLDSFQAQTGIIHTVTTLKEDNHRVTTMRSGQAQSKCYIGFTVVCM